MDRSPGGSSKSLAVLAVAAFLAPIVVLLAGQAIRSNRNEVADWLPASYDETARLKWFRGRFLADQFVIISWEGCTLGEAENGLADDPRIERLVRALRAARLPDASGGAGEACFADVTSGRETLKRLTSSSAAIPYHLAVNRLKGILIGPDGKQTCVLATLSRGMERRFREAVGRGAAGPLGFRKRPPTPLYVALQQAGIPVDEVRLGGPPIDNVSIDEEGERTLGLLAALSGAFGIGLAWRSLRSFRMTMVVFGCGVASAALSLALVPLTGGAVDAILMSMPALVYVLAVSGAIHFINYYRQAAETHELHEAVDQALRHAWRPALLCSVTTAIGLASLSTSDIVPICRFGQYSAAGVMATLAIVFTVLPAYLLNWPWRPTDKLPSDEPSSEDHIENIWTRWTHLLGQHQWLVMGGCVAAIVALCAGLPRVTTSIDLLKLFSPDARLVQDYAWFEQHLGRLVPLELVLRFPAGNMQEQLPADAPLAQVIESHSLLERLDLVDTVQRAVDETLGPEGKNLAGASMSVATFTRPVGRPGLGYGRTTERYAAAEALLAHRDDLVDTGFLRIDQETGEELWRVSLRVAAFHKVDHGQIVDELRSAVDPVFVARRSALNALRSLTAARGKLPSGSRVVLLCPEGIDPWAKWTAQALASKNILAAAVSKKPAELDAAALEAIKARDGVVLGRGTTPEDVARLQAAGAVILADYEDRPASADGSDVGIVYTGAVPIVYKAQRALLDSLIQSTWWSFASITPLMMFVCRSFLGGAIVMVPNVLPVLVVFGGMGWMGVPVDIGSMMAASIALGVAVDDTIHFLAWFRDDLHHFPERWQAVEAAFGRSATPTLQAALINGLGLSVFAVSSFTPTQRFGWLMLAILIVGVVAELVVLPAILLSPLGKVFHTQSLKVVSPDDAENGARSDAPSAA